MRDRTDTPSGAAKPRKGVIMTRQEVIKKLEEIKELIAWEDLGLTDYARERSYMDIVDAIDEIIQNIE